MIAWSVRDVDSTESVLVDRLCDWIVNLQDGENSVVDPWRAVVRAACPTERSEATTRTISMVYHVLTISLSSVVPIEVQHMGEQIIR